MVWPGSTMISGALYFDESGFSPNPPVQYGWGRIGRTRAAEPLAHRQRVNALGALRHDGPLIWTTQQRPTTRDDVIAFFDQIALQSHSVPRIDLPPYSPELNRIEILWKHAKHFWRRFVAKNGADLLDEIQCLMSGFDSKFTINFRDYLAAYLVDSTSTVTEYGAKL